MTQTSVSKLVILTGIHAGEGLRLLFPALAFHWSSCLSCYPVCSKAKGTCLLSVRFHLKVKILFKATLTELKAFEFL